jgi:hypothetical protein
MQTAKAQWMEALQEFTAFQITSALDYCRDNLEWPPSIAEFRNLCKVRKTESCVVNNCKNHIVGAIGKIPHCRDHRDVAYDAS